MPKVIVGRTIKIENPSVNLMKIINDELSIINPNYIQLEQMGKNTYGIPRDYKAFKVIAGHVIIPFGAVNNRRIKKELIGYQYEILEHEKYPIYLKAEIQLFDYQEKAMRVMLKNHRGILVAGTGSGKTNVGLHIIKELGMRALWVTHTTDLLWQSRQRARDVFSYIEDGTITAGKIDVGKDITFATVQTLSSCIDEVKDLFNVVIVDECHHCVGSPTLITMFYKVMNNLHAEYKYGLTATPKRPDGLEAMSFALLGDVAHTITKEEIAERVVPCDYKLIYNDKTYNIDDFTNSAGMIDPNKLAKLLAFDEERNNLIVDKIEKLSKERSGQLVLCKLVDHVELLTKMCVERGIKAHAITGKITSKKKRKELLNDDNIEVLIATSSLAKEGLDLIRYDTLVLTYSVAQKGEFTQTVGRVRRVNGDKKEVAFIYDVCDSGIDFLAKRTNTKRRWLKTIQ